VENVQETIAALKAELAACKRDREQLAAERDQWIQRAGELQGQVRALEAFERSVSEALNTGDGTYRP